MQLHEVNGMILVLRIQFSLWCEESSSFGHFGALGLIATQHGILVQHTPRRCPF
jgi:hypothetical protein